MPSETCFSSLKGLAMRVTRVDNCGVPIRGTAPSGGVAPDQVTSCGFVSIALAADIEDGTEYLVKTAAGNLCINELDCPRFKRYNVTIEFCQVDPELWEIITGNTMVVDGSGNSVGWEIGEDMTCDRGFALEGWSKTTGTVCGGETGIGGYVYWLLPNVSTGTMGDITLEDGPVSFTFTGSTRSNNWGVGPYDVVNSGTAGAAGPLLAPIPPAKHLHVELTSVPPPECICGYQALPAA